VGEKFLGVEEGVFPSFEGGEEAGGEAFVGGFRRAPGFEDYAEQARGWAEPCDYGSLRPEYAGFSDTSDSRANALMYGNCEGMEFPFKSGF